MLSPPNKGFVIANEPENVDHPICRKAEHDFYRLSTNTWYSPVIGNRRTVPVAEKLLYKHILTRLLTM